MVPRGTTYSGKGRIEQFSSAILDHARQEELKVSSFRREPSCISISLISSASVLRSLAAAIPRRIEYRLQQDDDRASITSTSYLHSWYVAVIVLFSIAWPILLFVAFTPDKQVDIGTLIRSLFSIGFGIGLFVPVHLLSALGGHREARCLEALQTKAARQQTVLSATGRPKPNKNEQVLLAYLAYSLVICSIFVAWKWDSFPLILVVVVLGTMVPLIIALGFLSRRDFSLRTAPLLPGFCSMLSMLTFLSVLLMWVFLISGSDERIQTLISAFNFLRDFELSGKLATERFVTLEYLVREFKYQVVASILLCLFIVGMAFMFFWKGVRISAISSSASRRLKLYSEQSRTISRAASGSGFLWVFRLIFGAVWITVGSLIVFGVGVAAVSFFSISGVGGRLGFLASASWVGASEQLVSLVFYRTLDSPMAIWSTRLAWICGSGLALSCFVASVAQLGTYRSRQWKDLVRRRSCDRNLLRLVAELSARFEMKMPTVCVSAANGINAWSYEFGLFRRRHIVEISSGALELLDTSRGLLEVIVAHELAHLRLGHVRRLNWARWFGRVTFTGDSFTFAFADGWGYELQADRFIVEQSKTIHPTLLLACLMVLERQILTSRDDNTNLRGVGMFPQQASEEIGFVHTKDRHARSQYFLQSFLRQYTQPFESTYWHPSIAARMSATKELIAARKSKFKEH